MPSNLKYFAAYIVFVLSAAGPVLAATPSDNVGGSYGVRDANAPKATAEERAAARKARSAEGRRLAAEDLKSPVNNQGGSYGVRDANAPKSTAEARAVASKARAAEGRRIAAENLKNPVNNQTGQPTK